MSFYFKDTFSIAFTNFNNFIGVRGKPIPLYARNLTTDRLGYYRYLLTKQNELRFVTLYCINNHSYLQMHT